MAGDYVFRFYHEDADGNLASPFIPVINTASPVHKTKPGVEQSSNTKYNIDSDEEAYNDFDEVYVKQDPHEPIKSFVPKYRKGLSVIGRPTNNSELVDLLGLLYDFEHQEDMTPEPGLSSLLTSYFREYIAKMKTRPSSVYGSSKKFTEYVDLAEKALDSEDYQNAIRNLEKANDSISDDYSTEYHKRYDDIIKDLGMREFKNQYSDDVERFWNLFKQSAIPAYFMSNNALAKAFNRNSPENADKQYERVLRTIKGTYDSISPDHDSPNTKLYLAGVSPDDMITTDDIINDSLSIQRDFPQELIFTKLTPKRNLNLKKFSDVMSNFDEKKKSGASARDIFYDAFDEDPDLLLSDTAVKQIIRDLSQDTQQASFNDIIDAFNCMRGC